MRMERARCQELLHQSEHGVLATVHAARGVDAVPACFVMGGAGLGVPIDRVKAKASEHLRRVRNLDADPRAALVCEHWDGIDWSRLWWVRASLERVTAAPGEREELESLLRAKYRQYRGQQFADVLVFAVTGLSGWQAVDPLDGPVRRGGGDV